MIEAEARSATASHPFRPRFRRPIFVVSSPRSGSTLLFQTLAQAPGIYTVGGESHNLIEGIADLHPRAGGWHSNRLTGVEATPAVAEELSKRFYTALRDREGRAPNGTITMLEKTPKNSLRVPFLTTVYPDARFLYLYRDARETLSSMLEAWTSGGFRTYPRLPDWQNIPWSLLLVPGWRELARLSLPEIVARQWAMTTTVLLDDLEALPAGSVRSTSYDDFLAAPQSTTNALCASLDVGWDRTLNAHLPLSPTVVSPPRPDKWRRHEAIIDEVWPIVEAVDARARRAAEMFAK